MVKIPQSFARERIVADVVDKQPWGDAIRTFHCPF